MHMMETLDALLDRHRVTTKQARAVVWAHNSHLGDARATQMGDSGELNLGQLVRQAHGAQSRPNVSVTTSTRDWQSSSTR